MSASAAVTRASPGSATAETRGRRADWLPALAVGAAGMAALVVLSLLVRNEPTPRGDDLVYEHMAQAPLATHAFPFAYRIAIPWLVHVLPFGHTLSFRALAWLCSGAAGALLYVLLRRVGARPRLAAALGIALVVSPPLLVASLRQGRNPDPMTLLVVVAGTLCIVERRVAALAVTMALGAANRESALFLGPFAYAFWAERPWDATAARRVLTATLPAAALFVTLRFAIPTVGREQVIGYGSALGGRVDVVRAGLADIVVQARRIFVVFGPLWLLAPLALRDLRLARRGLVLLLLCLGAMTFALDWARILLIAAPVVYPAAAHAMRLRPRLQVAVVVGWFVVIAAYAVYMDLEGVQRNIIDLPAPGRTTE